MFDTTQDKTHFLSSAETRSLFMIITLLLTYGYYFRRVGPSATASGQLGTLLIVTIVFIVMQILARRLMPFVFTRRSSSPLETWALLKASRLAYFVLLAGTFSTLLLSLITSQGWLIPNIVLTVVLAELTEHTTALLLMRSARSVLHLSHA
jgi:hypothetical protein